MNTSELKRIPIDDLIDIVKEKTNEEKIAQNITFAELKARALRHDEIRVHSIKKSNLYDLDIERPSNRKIQTALSRIETTDTYIPEPIRNMDGTPIYSLISDDEQHIISTSDKKVYTSSVGIFTQKQNPKHSDHVRPSNPSTLDLGVISKK